MVPVAILKPRNMPGVRGVPQDKFGGGGPGFSVTLDAMLWPVEPIDPVTAPDGDLAGLHNLEIALELEALPGEPVTPLAHLVAEYRHERPMAVRKAWVVRQGGATGEIAAWASASYVEVPENRNHAHAWVAVHPDVRGLGLGSTLMARVVDAARRWDCTVLDFGARVGGPGEPFLRALGAERRMIERRSRCRTADHRPEAPRGLGPPSRGTGGRLLAGRLGRALSR